MEHQDKVASGVKITAGGRGGGNGRGNGEATIWCSGGGVGAGGAAGGGGNPATQTVEWPKGVGGAGGGAAPSTSYVTIEGRGGLGPVDLSWTQAFIGIPYLDKGRDLSGCDCWGFVRLMYAERAGVELPSYSDRYAGSTERQEIAAIVAEQAASSLWEKVDQPRELDILWFRRGEFDAHCAVFLRPDLMMHMVEQDCSKIERLDRAPWQSRLTGIYRLANPDSHRALE